MSMTPGARFREALKNQQPLQIVGTINAYCAKLAEQAGHHALYLSGAGVANASFGLPDLGMTSLNDVLEDVRRVTGASSLPLLVDVDTGWSDAMGIARTIDQMQRVGAAAVHLEDQVAQKRCGHRPNKAIVSTDEMADRITAAVEAKRDPDFFIIARTDAYQQEGLNHAIERCQAYIEAGADGIFAEAVSDLDEYKAFASQLNVPTLANMTEFGKTPLYNTGELAASGCAMILYPLSAFRAMSKTAFQVYEHVLRDGHQKACFDAMQSREELYEILGYHAYEQKIDDLLSEREPLQE